jgi:hypothetical protein
MGYELNKLMSLYGVSTPGMPAYAGAANDPAAMQQYNQYRTDYMNRVAATPMYGEQQYRTGLAGEPVAPIYTTPIKPPSYLTLAGPEVPMGPPLPGTTTAGNATPGTNANANANANTNTGNTNTTNTNVGYIGGGLGLTTSPADQGNAGTYIGGGLGTDLLNQTRKLQSGDNPFARSQLVEMYVDTFDRLPDTEGFNHWLNTIGADNFISKDEENLFMQSAQKELGQAEALKGLYSKYLQREPDMPGREHWMSQISAAGGVTPEIERLFQQGANKEVSMGNAGYRSDIYDPNRMGSRITQEESAQLQAEAPFRFGTDDKGIANNYAREQLLDLYKENLGRMPDEAGFNWWLGQVGQDNRITPDEVNQFIAAAQPELNRAHGGGVHALAQKYNMGGAVRRFRVGGDEGEPDEDFVGRVVRERSLDMGGTPTSYIEDQPMNQEFPPQPVVESPATQPVKPPAVSSPPLSPAATDLMSMMNRYLSPESTYGPELETARKRLTAENAAFQDLILKSMKLDSGTPDKTEMYFRLAAAFGSPSKTGAFTENLAAAGKEMAEYSRDVRAAQRADRQLRLQLGLEGQKSRTQAARDELSTLRTLAGEEMKDKRAIVAEYLKSGRPQSEAGKAALDAGLVQGTPEYQKFVTDYIDDKIRSGNVFKEAMVAVAQGQLGVAKERAVTASKAEARQQTAAEKLSPAEVKLKSEAETSLSTIDNAMKDLGRAYDLNKDSFDTTLKDQATLTILEQTGSKDKRVLNTKELMNLLKSAMISSASEKLKGVLSDSDIKLLQSVAGLDAKSREERGKIMMNAYRALKAGRVAQQKRLNEISQGLYRETTPAPAGELD